MHTQSIHAKKNKHLFPLAGLMLLGLVSLTILTGCVHKYIMNPIQTYLAADENHAVISFVHGKQRDHIAIWQKESFLGITFADSILQCRVTAGKHLFLATDNDRSAFLMMEVEAGKHYVVLIADSPFLGIDLFPIIGAKANKRLASWFSHYQLLEPIAEERRPYEEKHQEKIKSVLATLKSGKRLTIRKVTKEQNTDFWPEPLNRATPGAI